MAQTTKRKHCDPISLLQLFNVRDMTINCAKFEQNLDSTIFWRELPVKKGKKKQLEKFNNQTESDKHFWICNPAIILVCGQNIQNLPPSLRAHCLPFARGRSKAFFGEKLIDINVLNLTVCLQGNASRVNEKQRSQWKQISIRRKKTEVREFSALNIAV